MFQGICIAEGTVLTGDHHRKTLLGEFATAQKPLGQKLGSADFNAREAFRAKDPQDIRTMLGVIAIAAGTRTHARFLLNYFDKESLEIERLASEVDFRLQSDLT